MGHYKANATNNKNFHLVSNNKALGELIYKKWYSFDAEIVKPEGESYRLEPKGFWDSKVELKDNTSTLLEFKMGWKGIIIRSLLNGREETFLFKFRGLLSNRFSLLDTNNEELLVAETSFNWSKITFDYSIETTQIFDDFDNKELLLLTIVHCINYYMTMVAAAV